MTVDECILTAPGRLFWMDRMKLETPQTFSEGKGTVLAVCWGERRYKGADSIQARVVCTESYGRKGVLMQQTMPFIIQNVALITKLTHTEFWPLMPGEIT